MTVSLRRAALVGVVLLVLAALLGSCVYPAFAEWRNERAGGLTFVPATMTELRRVQLKPLPGTAD